VESRSCSSVRAVLASVADETLATVTAAPRAMSRPGPLTPDHRYCVYLDRHAFDEQAAGNDGGRGGVGRAEHVLTHPLEDFVLLAVDEVNRELRDRASDAPLRRARLTRLPLRGDPCTAGVPLGCRSLAPYVRCRPG
jgi:hypothetical protein